MFTAYSGFHHKYETTESSGFFAISCAGVMIFTQHILETDAV